MNSTRTITVPLSEDAALDLCYYRLRQYCSMASGEFKVWVIAEGEFKKLSSISMFKQINAECGASINDGKIAWIDFRKLNTVSNILEKFKYTIIPEIMIMNEYVNAAILHETGIEFNFAGL